MISKRALSRVVTEHPVTGTIGILVLCVRRGLLTIPEGNAVLGRMIAASYRSPVAELDALV
jgi:predicted nucleic acid-binding protein